MNFFKLPINKQVLQGKIAIQSPLDIIIFCNQNPYSAVKTTTSPSRWNVL
jgi:hypothetical protein